MDDPRSGLIISIQSVDGGIELRVKVVPGASRSRVMGPLGNALKIQVAAPPEKGKANVAVEKLLARFLGLRHTDVSVVAGHSSVHKTILIRGLSPDQLRMKLNFA